MITRCDAYQKLRKYKYIIPKSKQRQLKSSFIETLFESKNVQNITFHCLQQLDHIYNNNNQRTFISQLELFFCLFVFSFKQSFNERRFQLSLPTYIYIYMDFLLFFLFLFPLTDPHISVTALLCVSLVNFLSQYCLCVNQLYRKKKQTNKKKKLTYIFPLVLLFISKFPIYIYIIYILYIHIYVCLYIYIYIYIYICIYIHIYVIYIYHIYIYVC